MSGLRRTKVLLVVAVALVIAYDVAVFVIHGVDATISRVALAWARQWPVVPFASGVVCGHLFWSQPAPPKG